MDNKENETTLEELKLEDLGETIEVAKPSIEMQISEEEVSEEEVSSEDLEITQEESSVTKFSAKEKKKLQEDFEAESMRDEARLSNALSIDEGIVKAGKNAFSSHVAIRPIGNRLEFENFGEQLNNKRSRYRIAANSYKMGHGMIMTGFVSSMDERKQLKLKNSKTGEITTQKTIWLIVNDGPIAVYIPIQNFTRFKTSSNMSEKEYTAQMRSYAKARLGSQIEYMVTSFNETSRIAIGTRLPVLDRKAAQYFLTKTKGRNYLCKEGDVVEARVNYITATTIGVEVFGVETAIPVIEVSWARVMNIYEYYKEQGMDAYSLIGKTVPVKLLSITRTKDNVEISASIKRAFDTRALYIRHLSTNMFVTGVIVTVNQNGIFAKIDNLPFDCICNILDPYNIPIVGSHVQLRITEIRTEVDEHKDMKYNIAAMITRVMG